MRWVVGVLVMCGFAAYAGDQGIDPSALPRLAGINEAPAPERFVRAEGLVETDGLGRLLETPGAKVVVLDARSVEAFKLGHIPGARNLQSDLFQDPARGPYFMPPPEALKQIAAQEGISAETRVVIYDEDDGRLAARIWFTFHAHGHENVSILNGGAGKWRDELRLWSTLLPELDGKGTFEPLKHPRGAVSFEELPRYGVRVHTLGSLPPVSLLDARTRGEYRGEESGGKLAGHIPGATNLPWTSMLAGKEGSRVWKSPQEIHALSRIAGVDKTVSTAIYDQAGGRSAHLYFTLWLLGHTEIRNYVGGWRDYAGRPGVEVER